MEDVKNSNTLDNSDAFFNSTFTHLDLNKDIQEIYNLIDDEHLNLNFNKSVSLTNLRNENYKRYNDIKILKYRELPLEFSNLVSDILELYDCVNVKNILADDYEESQNNKLVLDNIYERIDKLDTVVKSHLDKLTYSNDENQKKFSRIYFKNLNIDNSLKNELIEKYNDLVLHSSKISLDIYEEFKIQLKRKQYIEEILKSLNMLVSDDQKIVGKDMLTALNVLINIKALQYKDKINYLDDLIPNNSRYTSEFEEFKSFYNNLLAYDDENYDNARKTFSIISDQEKMDSYINNLEKLFINERDNKLVEEEFIYEKVGIKNIKKTLNYINKNYLDELDDNSKNTINNLVQQLSKEDCNLHSINEQLKLIVNNIWKKQITDIYEYNPDHDFYFICANNQFIDEKYQTILITKKEIEKVNDYEDYQIGFICNYDNNIMYITENDDIMSVDSDDMSNLKTPFQLEEEFINFKVCNRIALNGYITKLQAVYYINDGDFEKYIKALNLANDNGLPLLEIKKDNE